MHSVAQLCNLIFCQEFTRFLAKFWRSVLAKKSVLAKFCKFQFWEICEKVSILGAKFWQFWQKVWRRAARGQVLAEVFDFSCWHFSSLFGVLAGGLSIHITFSTSAVICALGDSVGDPQQSYGLRIYMNLHCFSSQATPTLIAFRSRIVGATL